MTHGRNPSNGVYDFAGPDNDSTAPHGGHDEFDDLASAVSALSHDDLAELPAALNAADAWDVDGVSGSGGFLADV